MSAPVDGLAVLGALRRTVAAQSKLSDDVMAHLADDAAQASAALAGLIEACQREIRQLDGTACHRSMKGRADDLRAALTNIGADA